MKTPHEFFQGPIAQEFPGLLNADVSAEAKRKKDRTTLDTKNPPCSVVVYFCKVDGTTPDTKAPPCSVVVKLCKADGTTPDTKAPPCSVMKILCMDKSPTTTPTTKAPPCSVQAKYCKGKKKKATGFLPAVEGWSMPPAPPAI